MSAAEYTAISRKAAASELPVSEFLRRAALRRQVWAKTDRDTVIQLSRIGDRLQTIAQTLDEAPAETTGPTREQLDATLAEVRAVLGEVGHQDTDRPADRLAPDETEPEPGPDDGQSVEPSHKQSASKKVDKTKDKDRSD